MLVDIGANVMYSPRTAEVISEATLRIAESSSERRCRRVKIAGIISE